MEVVALDREPVGECHTPSRGMAGIGPVAGYKQQGVKHPKLNHFACHAIDLHPAAQTDSVLTHQYKPAEKAHNEILQRHSEAGACQPQNRTELTWGAEDDQQNEEYRENLQRNAGNSAQRLHLAPVERCPSQQIFEPPIKEHADQQHAKNNGNADHAAVQNVSLLRGYDGDPFAVDVPKLFLVCDPLIQGDQRFLIFRAALGVFYDGGGFVPVAAGLFLGDGRALAELFRLFADLFLERDVPCGERICVGLCVLLGTPQLKLLLVPGPPLLQNVNEAAGFGGLADRDVRAVRRVRRSFVLLQHCLNAALRIAPRVCQVLLCLVDSVLSELELCLG